MFRWYREARICYAFLRDVSVASKKPGDLEKRLLGSRWFTRGWTLQELIAPTELVFYSREWEALGTKVEFADAISVATRIHKKYLGGDNLSEASIAQKMSWAAKRQTTRKEDVAYCLLGLFDINMPMIYGEGSKAFNRLQEMLLVAYPEDHTLFAWGKIRESLPSLLDYDPFFSKAQLDLEWRGDDKAETLHSLFASSPLDFEDSFDIIPSGLVKSYYSHGEHVRDGQIPALPAMAGTGVIRFEMPLTGPYMSLYYWKRPRVTQVRLGNRGYLVCCREDAGSEYDLLCLSLQSTAGVVWSRTPELAVETCPNYLNHMTRSIRVQSDTEVRLRSGDILFRRVAYGSAIRYHGPYVIYRDPSGSTSAILRDCDVFRTGTSVGIIGGLFFSWDETSTQELRKGILVVLSRAAPSEATEQPLSVSVIPVHFSEMGLGAVEAEYQGVKQKWYRYDDLDKAGATEKKIHEQWLALPSDTWVLDEKPFPSLYVHMERVPVDEETPFVDVMDLVISP